MYDKTLGYACNEKCVSEHEKITAVIDFLRPITLMSICHCQNEFRFYFYARYIMMS